MREISKKKKKTFEEFLKFKEKNKDSKISNSELVNKFNDFSKTKLNSSDHTRVKYVESFKKDNKYYDYFTVAEMEFLGIFEKKYGEVLFEKVADQYLNHLKEQQIKNIKETNSIVEVKNSLPYLKGLIGNHTDVELTSEIKTKIKNLNTLASVDNADILEIRKTVAKLCKDLKVTYEFTGYCNKFYKD